MYRSFFYLVAFIVAFTHGTSSKFLFQQQKRSTSFKTTPTTPFPYQDIAWSYLYSMPSSNGLSLFVTSDCPEYRCTVEAKAQWQPDTNKEKGWDFLHVRAPKTPGRLSTSYAAGYLEGYLTANQINLQTPNFTALEPTNGKIADWITSHLNYMWVKISENAEDPYWRAVEAVLEQVRGLADGFTAKMKSATNSTHDARFANFRQMFLFNFQNEIGDVATAISVQEYKEKHGVPPEWEQSLGKQSVLEKARFLSHCSAYVKVLPGEEGGIANSQDTWSSYTSMAYRQYKIYQLSPEDPKNDDREKKSGKRMFAQVTFSSYPATVASGDDWYITSKNLSTQETTDEVFNTTLYLSLTPNCVSEFIRVMVSNYLAESGKDWTGMFSYENSGTYNNQWMVIDYNKILAPKQQKQQGSGPNLLPAGLLWIAEQIPGYVERADVTDVLDQQGYWASFNFPYFKYIYDLSGYPSMVKKYGNFWSYTKYARPEIFKRNSSSVKSVQDVMNLMRYNNFEHDPLSLIPNCSSVKPDGKCAPPYSAMLAISSRGDLNPPDNVSHYGPDAPFVGQIENFGAIDSKVSFLRQRTGSLASYVISGPTYDQQPVFSWSASPWPNLQPKEASDRYQFPWLEFYKN